MESWEKGIAFMIKLECFGIKADPYFALNNCAEMNRLLVKI